MMPFDSTGCYFTHESVEAPYIHLRPIPAGMCSAETQTGHSNCLVVKTETTVTELILRPKFRNRFNSDSSFNSFCTLTCKSLRKTNSWLRYLISVDLPYDAYKDINAGLLVIQQCVRWALQPKWHGLAMNTLAAWEGHSWVQQQKVWIWLSCEEHWW